MAPIQRKLAAILAADVHQFSKLMGADEAGTLDDLRACRQIVDSIIAEHHGRIFGTAGDSVGRVCQRGLGREPFDAKAIVGHLRRHGIEPSEVGIRFGADGEGSSLYLHGPEGNRIELKGPPSA
jgi:glyoxylase I family protein